MLHKERSFSTPQGWLFTNPEEANRKAGIATGIGGDIGWHTFPRSY